MENVLEVKNLKISFRTSGGAVKAVRDISFNLEKGKTLAIVGESGSGKSVTSKAILGILAGNSIVEGGEIIYDGKDLLKITEEDMCEIRGDEISMIFQDPLSSLNPIVKIGKQITEAMLLKNKTSRKEARKNFNRMLDLLKKNMVLADPDNAQAIGTMIKTFDKFCIAGNKLELSYNASAGIAEAVIAAAKDILFKNEKKQNGNYRAAIVECRGNIKKINDSFFLAGKKEELRACADAIVVSGYKKRESLSPELVAALTKAQAMVESLLTAEKPDFYSIGYYGLKNPGEDMTKRSVAELNAVAQACLKEDFMDTFLAAQNKGVGYAFHTSMEKKQKVMPLLAEAKAYFAGSFTKADALKYAKKLAREVEDSIDRLEIVKDSFAYTLRSGLVNGIEQYFAAVHNNPKEEARFARQSKRREALIARGKQVDWKVRPKNVYDLDELKNNLVQMITRLEDRYSKAIANAENTDIPSRSAAITAYMKDKASKVVNTITRAMAREKAIKLMEEVGISEPRMRYKQYPFEFSGGMRQRIVIAIALSADPEILICDEPTTALDVTIQAQILELINRLKKERNLSVIFITHDLGVVANMADEIAVMYAGKIVEYGSADDIFYDPRHPYTWALLSSMPDLDTKEKLDAIPGTPPNMIYPPVGDAFADRNKYAMQIDFEQQPPMFRVSDTHWAATWLLHPDAPKVEIPRIITDRIARMKKTAGGEQNG